MEAGENCCEYPGDTNGDSVVNVLDVVTVECAGFDTFFFRWMFTVVLFPGALFAIVLTDFVLRRGKGTADTIKELQGNCFFVTFFCYPSMCNMLFSSAARSSENTLCRKIDMAQDWAILERLTRMQTIRSLREC